jgi:hypothetical protein
MGQIWARGQKITALAIHCVRALFVVLLVAGCASGSVAASASAHADPPCAQFDVCQYLVKTFWARACRQPRDCRSQAGDDRRSERPT